MTTLSANSRPPALEQPLTESSAKPESALQLALARKAAAGCRDTQTLLLRQLQNTWFRYCVSYLRDSELAKDATQETALRFLKKLADYRGDSRLSTWSLGIAVNVCREQARKRAKFNTAKLPERYTSAAPSEAMEAEETKQRLRELIDELSPRQQEAVLLRYFESLSVNDTATAMACAVGTVKATLAAALSKLESSLTQRGEETQ